MKKIISFVLFVMVAVSINANQLDFNQQQDDSNKKKENALYALLYAGMGLNNVMVDHNSEAISKIVANPDGKEDLLYRPQENAPDDFISFYNEHLFSHESWIINENRIKTHFKDVYTNAFMGTLNENDKDYRKKQLEMSYLAQKMVDRFIIPNYRSIYLNWIYFDDYRKEDIGLVIDGLSGKIDKKNANLNNDVDISKNKDGIINVDTNIPISPFERSNTFAIIIANEKYKKESSVEFAENDGRVFYDYCKKALGIPVPQIHYIPNATLNKIIYELDWLKDVCEAYHGEANIIFYYSGHGVPNSKGAAYLIPIDGTGKNLRTCMSLEELYSTLGGLEAQRISVIMDACFSGAQRSGDMMEASRGVAIKIKQSDLKGNMIVLSAAKDDETAYSYKQAGHGLFTYYLLKKLQETKGNVCFGDLIDYLKDEVGKTSIVKNGKSQSPTISYSPQMNSIWRTIVF